MITNTVIVLVFSVFLLGVWLYITIARNDFRRISKNGRSPWRLKSFFLGGGDLGADLTENNTIGMTFAWSGGVWYFAWTGYTYGPWIAATQVFWCLSIVVLALLLPRLIARLSGRTIHGFLREYYGPGTQRVAAIATTAGYIINGGYETYWSSKMFAQILGRPDLDLPVALGVAALVGTYCTIGGYRSNATVDKPHNILGVGALAALLLLVTKNLHIGGAFELAVWIFALGSTVYLVMSALSYFRSVAINDSVLTVIAILFLAALIGVVLFLSNSSPSEFSPATLTKNDFNVPPYLIVATVGFQMFFNTIDMQSWQQIAANSSLPKSQYRGIQWSIIRASIYLFWFPALGGTLLGCAMHMTGAGLQDSTIFTKIFEVGLGNIGSEVIRGLALGVLLLAFISTSMSTIDSLAMSALQTVWYDIVHPKRIERLMTGEELPREETRVVMQARAFLIPITLAMALIFYGLYRAYPGPVILFQSVMYALPLALYVPALFALSAPKAAMGRHDAAFWGILLALVVVPIMFVFTIYPGASEWQQNWLPALMPVVGLLSTSLTMLLIWRRKKT